MKKGHDSKSPGLLRLLLSSMRAWSDDDAFSHAASVSFYTLFSMAPVTLIVLTITGFFFGKESANTQLMNQLTQLVGEQSAKSVLDAAVSNAPQDKGWLSTSIAVAVLLVGATTVFAQLQSSLNDIWGVVAKPRQSGIVMMLLQRMVSFAMVLAIGFVLLVSLFVSTGLTSAEGHFGGGSSYVFRGLDLLLGLAVVTVLFALVFKVLPDVLVAWKDAWMGALLTSIFFSVGRFLIALYLGHSTVASIYGASGSLVALLVWVYYSCAILFFGAEFTRARMTQAGRVVHPKKNAVLVRREILS
jgi:membrane protein